MGVMYSVLKIITHHKTVLMWPQELSCEINLAAWDVLRKITPYLVEDFVEVGGPTRYLLLRYINALYY